jgi:hypothetical protein
MKFRRLALTTLLTTIGLTVPAIAQIQNPSQDFFEQGREQLEREIQILQTEPPDLEQSLQEPQSEPLLEVPASPVSEPSQPPNEDETPSQPPNEVNNSNP